MFSPPEYVPLAKLWNEFLGKHRQKLTAIARQKYHEPADDLIESFGSPMDFCEDVFVKAIDDVGVFAAAENGNITRLESTVDGGRSRLFLKMSVFESAIAAKDPLEAGKPNADISVSAT